MICVTANVLGINNIVKIETQDNKCCFVLIVFVVHRDKTLAGAYSVGKAFGLGGACRMKEKRTSFFNDNQW